MRAKWRKIIWAILAVQLLLLHLLFLVNNYEVDYLVYRAVRHFEIPYFLYDRWKLAVTIIWLVSAGSIMIIHYMHYIRFRKCCIRELGMISKEDVKSNLEKAILETGLKSGWSKRRGERNFLYSSQEIREPFVIGFKHPILLLPDRAYSEQVLHFIFLHECYHIKHKDTIYKLFMLLMQSLLWFQPLMYLLKAISYRDVEVACDEAVVEGKDMEARKAYGYALLECMKQERGKGQAYSTYFYHGKQLMKARLTAIMEEEKKWDWLAVLGIIVLLSEVGFCIYKVGNIQYVKYQEKQKEAETTIYDGYHLPENFSETAVANMIQFTPVSKDAYYEELWAGDFYEDLEYSELPYEAEGPWQIRIRDADHYVDAIAPLLQRYLSYYIDQEWATVWNPETSGYTILESVYSRLLAGNKKEAVFAVVFKYYVGNEEQLSDFPIALSNQAQFVYEGGAYYAYFNWAVQIRMAEDYVFELEGIADTKEVLDAYEKQYVQADFSDVPSLDLVDLISDNWVSAAVEKNGTEGPAEAYQIDISTGVLKVSGADGVMQEVPITLEELFARGDEMDGKLTSLQEGSYQVDENKIIFAYGGYADIPFSVIFYEKESQSYKKSVVTYDFFGGRRIFVNFPENGQDGFLLVTGERVVWQEATILFRTKDGGKTWKEVGAAGPDMAEESHSLTTGAVFINNQVGFVTIRDSKMPDIWRTEDGGLTWEKQLLPNVPAYYSMAYAPEYKDGVLALYVGMEEYSEYGGTKAKYISTDEGRTWSYEGIVLRK